MAEHQEYETKLSPSPFKAIKTESLSGNANNATEGGVVQSMKDEIHRLKVTKSYLDNVHNHHPNLQRLVQLATRLFQVPTAVISLLDLGKKQVCLAQHGNTIVNINASNNNCPNSPTLPICTQLVQSTETVLQIQNVAKHAQFASSVRNLGFYAAAALISPEGYKLGTFCLLDTEPHDVALSSDQLEHLVDLASVAVQAIVDQRQLQQHSNREDPAQLIAYAAHDLMTPLSGVQLSLSLLAEDEQVARVLNDHQMELLTTATSCSDLTIRICETAIESLRKQTHQGRRRNSQISGTEQSNNTNASDASASLTNVIDLVKSLKLIMEPIPKLVPLVISLDPSVPPTIRSDDLKLFRAALNLVSSATERAERGKVHLRIFLKPAESYDDERPLLVFECEDSAPDIPVELYQYLFQQTSSLGGTDQGQSNNAQKQDAVNHHSLLLALSSVASLVQSMGGEYKFRPRNMSADGSSLCDEAGQPYRGSVFSFEVQLEAVEADAAAAAGGTKRRSPSLRSLGLRKSGSSNNRGFFWQSRNRQRRTPSHHNFFAPVLFRTASSGSVLSTSQHQQQQPHMYGAPRIPSTIQVAPGRAASWHSFGSAGQFSGGGSHLRPTEGYANAVFDIDAYAAAPPKPRTEPLWPEWAVGVKTNSMAPPAAAAPMVEAPAPPPAAATTSPAKDDGPRKKLALVIEDSVVVRKGLVRALGRVGFDEVKQAVNGLEGLERMKEDMFDMVLCDFLMPVMDGLDCVKQYREWEQENRPTHRQPIIGISAHVSKEESGQGIDAGMDDFRPKPIQIKTLTELQGCEAVVNSTRFLDGMAMERQRKTKETKTAASAAASTTANNSMIPPAAKAILPGPSTGSRAGTSGDGTFGVPANKRSALAANLVSSRSTASISALKRLKVEQPERREKLVCLVVMEADTLQAMGLVSVLESTDWKVVPIHKNQDASRLLRMRNWDAVLLDEEMPDAWQCVADFRDWEGQNRVNEQRNVFLLCDGDIPDPLDVSSVVQPPSGFNGVLRKPLACRDLNFLMKKKNSNAMKIVLNRNSSYYGPPK